MNQKLPEEWFTKDTHINAGIAWLIVGLLGLALVGNFLTGQFVTAAFAGAAVVVAIIPPYVRQSWKHTVPWPLLLIASLPFLMSTAPLTFEDEFLSAIGLAMLAMLLVVSLQMTTAVRMTPNFALFFVLISTLGITGFWAVGSAASAVYLQTSFVETNSQLMYVFIAATLAGIVAAVIFRWYFRRQLRMNAGQTGDIDTEAVR